MYVSISTYLYLCVYICNIYTHIDLCVRAHTYLIGSHFFVDWGGG